MSVLKANFLMIIFGIYDDLTSEHVPGLLKYDVCMTEQVSGPQGTKIAGRHMAMIPNCSLKLSSKLTLKLILMLSFMHS